MSKDCPHAVKVRIVVDGMDERARTLPMHPSEVIVAVTDADGHDEEVIVDRRSLSGESLGIGHPVGRDGDRLLVELPRETAGGAWRVWVPEASVVPFADPVA